MRRARSISRKTSLLKFVFVNRKASVSKISNSAYAGSVCDTLLPKCCRRRSLHKVIPPNPVEAIHPHPSIHPYMHHPPTKRLTNAFHQSHQHHRHLPAALPPPSSSSSSTSAGVLIRSCRLLCLLRLLELILLALSSGISSLAASSKPSSVSLSQRSPSWLAGVLRRASGSMEPRRLWLARARPAWRSIIAQRTEWALLWRASKASVGVKA